MKANELRLGNWVILDWTGNQYPFDEQIEITNFSVLKEFHEGQRQYSGIPLTEEWLVRFGFKDFKTDYGIMLNTLDRHLVVMPARNEYYPCIEVEAEFASGEKQVCHLNKIEYVHSLQNLYWCLTGEELTYKP
jgi:hypothetical protein